MVGTIGIKDCDLCFSLTATTHPGRCLDSPIPLTNVIHQGRNRNEEILLADFERATRAHR